MNLIIHFKPTLKHPLDGVYSALAGILPDELSTAIKNRNPNEDWGRSQLINIALGLPIKVIENDLPALKFVVSERSGLEKARVFQHLLEDYVERKMKS